MEHHRTLYDIQTLDKVSQKLLAPGKTIAVAESVTAGLLQGALALAKESTRFFQGGVTVYNIHQKVRLLGVDAKEAAATNCVSEQVAVQMAKGVIDLFGTDIGVGVTGYAAPLDTHPGLGLFAHYAITSRARTKTGLVQYEGDPSDACSAQLYYVDVILDALYSFLCSNDGTGPTV